MATCTAVNLLLLEAVEQRVLDNTPTANQEHVKEVPNLAANDMILLTDERLPPLSWPLGRIMEVYLGNDGHVRSVLVRTQNGVYKRPAYKARKLPGQNDQPN